MEPVRLRNYSSDVKPQPADDRRFYTVADVCALLGITRKTLFFYDRQNLLKPALRQGPQNAKLYQIKEISRLKEILAYKQAGLLLREIRDLLDGPESRKPEILNNALIRAEGEKKKKEEEILLLRQLIAVL